MKYLIAGLLLMSSLTSFADDRIKMNYKNEELPVILENYSKATGQKFIIDSTVRGKITILNSEPVSKDEAFNAIAEAMAINGFTYIKNGDVYTWRNARSAQRDNIEVFTTVPPAKPQHMVTWIISLKYVSAMSIQQQLRLLTSSYGEMSAHTDTNQIVMSDFTSNMQRINEIIRAVDIPMDPKIEKLVANNRKEMDQRNKKWDADKKTHPPKTPPPPPEEKAEN